VERRTLKRLRTGGVIAAIIVAAVVVGARSIGAPRRAPAPDVTAPSGERVRVQVLNAAGTRGLARRATQQLRDRGFDVVEVGTASQLLDSTLVLDRSGGGHGEWARRVADALGGARVEARPDSSRYLDVTVLLGRSWRAPAKPFYP
jgi:hypothetical protein